MSIAFLTVIMEGLSKVTANARRLAAGAALRAGQSKYSYNVHSFSAAEWLESAATGSKPVVSRIQSLPLKANELNCFV
jgi:hypothetical protein